MNKKDLYTKEEVFNLTNAAIKCCADMFIHAQRTNAPKESIEVSVGLLYATISSYVNITKEDRKSALKDYYPIYEELSDLYVNITLKYNESILEELEQDQTH